MEQGSVSASSDFVDDIGFEIAVDCAWNIFALACRNISTKSRPSIAIEIVTNQFLRRRYQNLGRSPVTCALRSSIHLAVRENASERGANSRAIAFVVIPGSHAQDSTTNEGLSAFERPDTMRIIYRGGFGVHGPPSRSLQSDNRLGRLFKIYQQIFQQAVTAFKTASTKGYQQTIQANDFSHFDNMVRMSAMIDMRDSPRDERTVQRYSGKQR